MACVTSTSFVVLINGSTSPFFQSSRGLWQGDPISPYLFLLVTEGLSQALHQARSQGIINGVKIVGHLTISHLLFIDDILLFGLGTIWEGHALKGILDIFTSAKGMVINTKKSAMYMYGIDENIVGLLHRLFSIPHKNWEGGLKYLGYFIKSNGYKKSDWNWLIARIEG
jgi:hypothetical protein